MALPWLRRLSLEPLEERALLSATLQYDHVVYSLAGAATPPSTAFTPAQIKTAYGIDLIADLGVRQEGAGQTIAVITAYDNPEFVGRNTDADVNQDAAFLASDLHKFDARYGLPEPAGFFTKVDQRGGTDYPICDTGWGTEIALDVEWVHAIAPSANIILVEADSADAADLLAAAAWARDHSGASVVVMGFSGGEFGEETAMDAIFHSSAVYGITWVASTGSSGEPGGYPAFSPNVLAVGGTILSAPGGVYGSEAGWSGSGGGISTYEAQPTYQQGLLIHDGGAVVDQDGMRAIPDVSFDADPASGVVVYDSFAHGTSAPWVQVGGTSLAASAWGGLLAIADEVRANHGLPSLDGVGDVLPALYDPCSLRDIVAGSNGYSAATGYDLVTGRGTPMADALIRDLAGVAFVVRQSTPARDAVVATPPFTYAITFASPVDPTSLQADDLRVNTTPADDVTLSADGKTATFMYDVTPVADEGLQSMSIAAGAVTKLGDPAVGLEPFTVTFRYDTVLLDVASTSPAPGGFFTLPGPASYEVTFNEPVAPESVTTGSLVLSGIGGATVSSVTVLAGNTTARFTIDGVATEGTLTASIAAGAVTDQFGNPGAAFTASYAVDTDTMSLTGPATPLAPNGSMIYYLPVVSGIIGSSGDTDALELAVNLGQTVSVLVTPTSAGLQPTIQFLDPDHTVLRTATAAAAGQNVLVQTAPIAAGGTYTIVVSGADTSGGYTVLVALNAALEEESNLSGIANDSLAAAQSLDGSFIDLIPSSTARRGAVVGSNTAGATRIPVIGRLRKQLGWLCSRQQHPGNRCSAGLWHLSTRRGAASGHSATTSFYYGTEATGTYDTGAGNSGTLTSSWIALPVDFLNPSLIQLHSANRKRRGLGYGHGAGQHEWLREFDARRQPGHQPSQHKQLDGVHGGLVGLRRQQRPNSFSCLIRSTPD